jgi:hypothetical protein
VKPRAPLPARLLLALLTPAILTSVVFGQAPVSAPAQTAPPATSQPAANSKDQSGVKPGDPIKADTLHNQRRAAGLYLKGVRMLEQTQAEESWLLLKQAAELEPFNSTYVRAAELARQSAITQLVQRSTQEVSRGDTAAATKTLQHALAIDPSSQAAIAHLNQLHGTPANLPPPSAGAVANPSQSASAEPQLGQQDEAQLGHQVGLTAAEMLKPQTTVPGGPVVLEPANGKHSFHLHSNQKQVIEEVFRAYGLEASVHESIVSRQVRFDVDDATFPEAMKVLSLVTRSFYEPLDPHRVLVASDTRQHRQEFQRLQMETVYLPGLTSTELTDVSNLARNVFDAQQAVAEPGSGTLTLRAPGKTLAAFNQTVERLEKGKPEVDLDVKIIELSHVSSRETGATFFQTTGVYNVFSEINTILSQNQSLVQQIISSGLVPNASTLANQIEILAILVASGQLTGTPFNQGFLPFGNGLTQSILSPSPATLTLSLNSSDSHELDDVHLRLTDNEAGTFKTGERYPIETSSYSSLALTAASAAGISNQTVPQIQYEDLGLTLKATPRVMRSGDLALTLDLKIEALGGTSLNGIPVLDNRSITGVITVRDGESTILLSDINRQESRALNGLPGIADIPGLQDINDIQKNQNVAKLLILITPTVERESLQPPHSPVLMVDKATH